MPPPSPARDTERRVLRLRLHPSPAALLRVVTLVARRQCVIVACDFDAEVGLAILTVTGRRSQVERLPLWLAGLVDVLAVGQIADAHQPAVYAQHSEAVG